MSQENVERLRVAHDAFLAVKSEFGGELLDPDIEWDASDSPVRDHESGLSRHREACASSGESGTRPGRPSNSRTN